MALTGQLGTQIPSTPGNIELGFQGGPVTGTGAPTALAPTDAFLCVTAQSDSALCTLTPTDAPLSVLLPGDEEPNPS